MSCSVVVSVVVDGGDAAEGAAVASRLALPMVPAASRGDAGSLLLAVTPSGLELREAGQRGGVRVDFSTIDLRTGAGNLSRKQPLARAVGRQTTTVVDATAGLGHDSGLLAAMGFDVTAIERSPVLAAMLSDAVRRAGEDPVLSRAVATRMRVVGGDARSILATLEPAPDAIYVDPMFPPKRKASALPPRRVQLVRALVGTDPDAAELVEIARRAARRVVVKRPDYARPVAPDPQVTIESKLVRYDVYVRN